MNRHPGHGGRPSKFDVHDVLDAALRCIRSDGLDALTIRAVAAEMGSSPTALYRHIEGSDDLVARCVDDVLGIAMPNLETRSQTDRWLWLRAVTQEFRINLISHPGVAEHLMAIGPTGPQGLHLMDSICSVILDSGLGPKETAEAYTLLMITAAGFCARSARLSAAAEIVDFQHAENGFGQLLAAQDNKLESLRTVLPAFDPNAERTYNRAMDTIISTFLPPDAHPGTHPPQE